ncbi:hypothetical protein GCM10027026_25570 [Myroides odoratimimus subsp. xuanwuensis]
MAVLAAVLVTARVVAVQGAAVEVLALPAVGHPTPRIDSLGGLGRQQRGCGGGGEPGQGAAAQQSTREGDP